MMVLESNQSPQDPMSRNYKQWLNIMIRSLFAVNYTASFNLVSLDT